MQLKYQLEKTQRILEIVVDSRGVEECRKNEHAREQPMAQLSPTFSHNSAPPAVDTSTRNERGSCGNHASEHQARAAIPRPLTESESRIH